MFCREDRQRNFVGVQWFSGTKGGRWNGRCDGYYQAEIIEPVKSEAMGFLVLQMVVTVESVEPPSKSMSLPEGIMETMQTMPADVLKTVAMNDSGTQTEEVVLSKAEWQSRLSCYTSAEIQTDALLISGRYYGSCVQAQETTLGTN